MLKILNFNILIIDRGLKNTLLRVIRKYFFYNVFLVVTRSILHLKQVFC